MWVLGTNPVVMYVAITVGLERMRRVVLPFSHGVRDQSTFNYNKSIVDSEETLLLSGT